MAVSMDQDDVLVLSPYKMREEAEESTHEYDLAEEVRV